MKINAGQSALANDDAFHESLPQGTPWKGNEPHLHRDVPNPQRFAEIHADLSEQGYRPTHKAIYPPHAKGGEEVHHEYQKQRLATSPVRNVPNRLERDPSYPKKYAVEKSNGEHHIKSEE